MIGKLLVINRTTERPRLPFTGVYVGRPSILGNPFVPATEAQRPLVIDRYEEWLRYRMQTDNQVSRELKRLVAAVRSGHSLALECYCAPKKCHADVIKKVIEEIIKENPCET